MKDYSADVLKILEAEARYLIAKAKAYNVVITIEQVPNKPLAMGNCTSVVSVRPARNKA